MGGYDRETACTDSEDCPASDNCERPTYDQRYGEDFWLESGDEEKGCCDNFICNCSEVRYIGSNKHGSYYKCKICGEEEEG